MINSPLPFSEACERNKDPIWRVISPYLTDLESVLEIGSGTGQHAVYFGQYAKSLKWQTSDRQENVEGIQLRLSSEGTKNVLPPLVIDVNDPWTKELKQSYDAIFTANTLHIMSWTEVSLFFDQLPNALNPGGYLMIYGPFSYRGKFTSESNKVFDSFLKERDPLSGIRDYYEVEKLASDAGLVAIKDYAMPANNQLLIFKKSS